MHVHQTSSHLGEWHLMQCGLDGERLPRLEAELTMSDFRLHQRANLTPCSPQADQDVEIVNKEALRAIAVATVSRSRSLAGPFLSSLTRDDANSGTLHWSSGRSSIHASSSAEAQGSHLQGPQRSRTRLKLDVPRWSVSLFFLLSQH